VAVLGLAVWGPTRAGASMLEGPVMRASESMELRGALLHGEIEKLRRLANRHDDAGSLLARAYLAELEGDLDRAKRFVTAARRQAVDDEQKLAADLARGRLLKAAGEWEAAEQHFRETLTEHPDAHHHRTALGSLLIDRGARREAEPVLDKLSHDFNAGRLDSASGLHALARAMERLGSFKDANHAFQLAHDKDGQHLPALVDWGHLFLAKYNTSDAEKTFRDALDVNDQHPGALIGMARVVMETRNYYEEARRYLDRAEEVFPASPELKLARAEIAIYDGRWDRALGFANDVLEARPKHLDAWATKAAVHYLQDDTEAYEKARDRALEVKPDFAGLYATVARFAVKVHRYREGVELNRKALELRDDHPEALLGLGVGLSRLGKLDRAVENLQKAFDVDPYNVRAYNMLEFFDEKLPDYRVFRHDGFLLRAHRSQANVLDEIVSPLVGEAMETYGEKYGFVPEDEVSVEVYPDPKTFGVRTVGLPNISPHGICFGPVVATRSPEEGNFNWRQVVWHEMAHVFHIQESGYRVPRWFTEGLAEYETNVKEADWIRHYEPRIAAALQDGEIPSIVDLDRQFTQAKSYRDILQAYHLSSLVLHFIVDTWKFEAVDEMIDGFGEFTRTERVIEKVLEVDVETFDSRFRDWLGEKLRGFDQQLLIDLRGFAAPGELEESVPPSRRDGWYHARMAVGQLRKGESGPASQAMERALEIGSSDPRVQYVASAFYANRGRTKKAYEHGLKVLDEGRDDYRLRVRLGRLARVLERPEAARVHLRAAVELYPDGRGAWKQLYKVAQSSDDDALERTAIRRMFELDQTDATAAELYTRQAIEAERWETAGDGVDRWLAIQPFEPEVHRTRVRVSLNRDSPGEAFESWKLLAELRPKQAEEIWQEAASRFEEAGYGEFADRAETRTP
jgi:tetratricopeptide (TPR) repeat protein